LTGGAPSRFPDARPSFGRAPSFLGLEMLGSGLRKRHMEIVVVSVVLVVPAVRS
jgi:hypothetical protein